MVARFVAGDVGEQVLQQRLLGEVPHLAEGVQREPLDHDLHADELLHPVAGLERRVEDALQRRGDGMDVVELLDVAREHLDVSRLVHRLRRRIELGIGVRHRVHELRRDHERPLLAVQKLREPERRRPLRQLRRRLHGQRPPVRGLLDRHAGAERRRRELDEVDRAAPVEVALGDPLRLGRLHVEPAQLVDLGIVVPLVDDLHRAREAGLLGGRGQLEVVHRRVPPWGFWKLASTAISRSSAAAASACRF